MVRTRTVAAVAMDGASGSNEGKANVLWPLSSSLQLRVLLPRAPVAAASATVPSAAKDT
jgi:hypothetical protein